MTTTDLCLDAMNMPPPDDDWDEEDDGAFPEDEEDMTDEGDFTPPEDEDTEPPVGCPSGVAWEGGGASPPPSTASCLPAAIEYARWGWPVLPVHSICSGTCTCGRPDCERPGKHPVGYLAPHGLRNATTDPGVIQSWWQQTPWANVGVVCCPTSFVSIDLDRHRHDQDGVAEAQRLFGWEPKGPVAITGGNGLLALYAHPGPGTRVKSRRDKYAIAPGVELGGDGSYVVMPPSVHESGRSYSWQVPLAAGGELPPLPAWALNGNTPEGVEQAEQAATQGDVRPSAADEIEEGERNGSLLRFGCALRRVGAAAEEIEAALGRRNLDRCSPPLPPEDVSKIAMSAARYESCEDPDQSLRVPMFKSVRSLLADHPDLHPPVIDGLLRQGETLNIIAPPKRCKSWLATGLALAVAAGTDWLGFPTRQGKVLILDNELHLPTLANRIPRVASALGIDLACVADNLCVESLRGRLSDILRLAPYFQLLHPHGFKLIIIDSLYRFLPAGADENSNAGMGQVYNALDKYAQELGCAIVVIHHSSKGGQAGKALTDVGAGAGALARAADAHLILREHEVEGAVAVEAVTRSFPPPEPFSMRWDFPVWMLAPDLDPTLLRTSWSRRKPPQKTQEVEPKPEVTIDAFINACASETPCIADELLDEAVRTLGVSRAEAKRWFNKAREAKRLHEWTFGAAKKRRYATVPQPDPTT